ncbi:MAG: 3-methylornithyl-N6-L-lysine dehydrogenase PylD [Candidatus Aminicenantes bacterium]|nr:3-methylornithyl-N6-L-lysine dehydrogenase PylD [Candidatus Aminicenantes bacterium]
MTRLVSSQVVGIVEGLEAYDGELLRKTGLSLRQIAARAAGSTEDAVCHAFRSELAAVVPITAGKGVIKGFAQSVAGIISYMGCPCFITDHADAAGLADGIERGSNIVFLADDHRFVAVKLSERRVVDNAAATAWAYACALDSLVGGLKGRDVLLIGAGKVGEKALMALDHFGAKVGVFDIDQKRSGALAAKFGVKPEKNLSDALLQYTYFFDASPALAFILPEHIKPGTAVAACGIPLGLSEEARMCIKERIIYDPLQLGTATMLAMVVSHRTVNNTGGRSEGSHRP